MNAFPNLRVAAGLAVLGTAISIAPAPLDAQASGSYSLSGDRVAVYNIAGIMRVQSGSGSDVRVEVQADGADAGELEVETGRIRSTETLRVIYPYDRIVYPDLGRGSRSDFRVRDDGTFFGDEGSRRGRRILISGSGRGMEAWADITVSIPSGKRVAVYLGVGEVDVTNVDGNLLVDVASAPVTASGTRGVLTIDTGSGSVEVRDAEGEVEVDTGSGSVDVIGVRGERLLVDTGSGSVDGSDIDVRNLNIDTGSGRIDVRQVASPDVVLDTGSGSVRVELLTDVENLEVDTGSGSVTVTVPEDLGAEIDVETSSGGIDFDMPVTVTRFGRSSLRGRIGDGRGRIHIDTGSGSVRLITR
jgi:hypothetical protein